MAEVFFWPDREQIRHCRASWLDACRAGLQEGSLTTSDEGGQESRASRVDRKTAVEMVGHKPEAFYLDGAGKLGLWRVQPRWELYWPV